MCKVCFAASVVTAAKGGSTHHIESNTQQLYKYRLCLSVVVAGATGQDSAGFQAARLVEGAAHSLLRATKAARCGEFPLIFA